MKKSPEKELEKIVRSFFYMDMGFTDTMVGIVKNKEKLIKALTALKIEENKDWHFKYAEEEIAKWPAWKKEILKAF